MGPRGDSEDPEAQSPGDWNVVWPHHLKLEVECWLRLHPCEIL